MRTFPSQRSTSGSQVPDIIVALHRGRTMLWLTLNAIGIVLLFLCLLFLGMLLLVIPVARNGGVLFCALLLGAGMAFGIWSLRQLAALLSSDQPVLVINHKGIGVGKLYGSRALLLPWGEIGAIYLLRDMLQRPLFCIRPRHGERVLPRFSPMIRFFLRSGFLNGAPLAFSQTFLEKPIEELFEQLQTSYARELVSHHIQLQPSDE